MNPTLSLIAVLALIQFAFFGALVARARATHGVAAPGMTGPAAFEHLVRVHLNTQERLTLFLPLLWLAAQVGNEWAVAGAGVVYLAGRMAYWRGYVQAPAQRKLGNILTMMAIAALLLITLAGLVQRLAA